MNLIVRFDQLYNYVAQLDRTESSKSSCGCFLTLNDNFHRNLGCG